MEPSAREVFENINVTQFDVLDTMCPPRWLRIDEIESNRAYGRLRKFTLEILKSKNCIKERELNGETQYKITGKGLDVVALGLL